jgi:subtilase family serine protease
MRATWARVVVPLIAVVLVASCSASGGRGKPTSLPPVRVNPDHVRTLAAVLDGMVNNYAKLAESSPGPQDILDYNVGALWKQGIDGTGTTIALIEGWDDPRINDVIRIFDQRYGLPDPEIQTIYPSDGGHLPAQCPPGMVALGSYGSCDAWKGELELDVEAAHLIAPYAKIVISATPADSEITDDAASQVAPPEMMQALEYIAKNHLADVISISDGTGESTFSYGKAGIIAQEPGLLSAAAAGIPVLAATGDCGVVQNLPTASSQCATTTTMPDTAAWDDSVWVTAVGGSVPHLDTSGRRLGPDEVWHQGKFAEGAGYSAVYPRPAYQDRVSSATRGGMRGVPDLAMDAQSGTSEAAPLLAGVLALAAQLNHGSVGPINTVLYDVLGPRGDSAGVVDIVTGNNSMTSQTAPLPGFAATTGFDVASGWGTIDASRFVPELVAARRAQNRQDSLQTQALDALTRLQHSVQLTTTDIPPGGSTYLFAAGFLPQHPVEIDIDDRKVTTLTANTMGSISYILDPSLLKLPRAAHTLAVKSMLLNAVTNFQTG